MCPSPAEHGNLHPASALTLLSQYLNILGVLGYSSIPAGKTEALQHMPYGLLCVSDLMLAACFAGPNATMGVSASR